MKHFILISVFSSLLAACMPFTPEKAPCDQWANGCGQKTKINQW